MWQLIPSLMPIAINAVKELLKKEKPEIADTIDNILADPKTQIELEKLALEKMKLDQNITKWELEDRDSARELAIQDVMSDSWLSKNIRPLTLIVLTAGFLLLVFMSAHTEIKTPDKLIELYASLLTGVYFFYFGSRGIEKTVSIVMSNLVKKSS